MDGEHANGNGQGPRIQRREVWADLPEDGYAGFRVKIWVNYPVKFDVDVATGEGPRVLAACKQIVLEHNGWLDFEGKLYPSPQTDEFWEAIPTELGAVIIATVNAQKIVLPKLVMPSLRR
jgi:hypothetical protein